MKRGRLGGLIAAVALLGACAAGQDALDPLAAEMYRRHPPPPPHPSQRFVSDGCSWWFDGDWVACCIAHDLAYWRGGTRDERRAADEAMRSCVAEQGHAALSHLMYLGVRVGGVWWLPTPFRWGFGWPYPEPGPPGVPY